MSDENIAVVREGVTRFSASDIAGVAELYTVDAFMVAPEGAPEGGRFEGRDAVMRQYARLLEDWDAHAMWIDGVRSGGAWVVVSLTWSAEGRASHAPIAMTVVGAYRLERGKIAEARFFWDFEQALKAVGLSV